MRCGEAIGDAWRGIRLAKINNMYVMGRKKEMGILFWVPCAGYGWFPSAFRISAITLADSSHRGERKERERERNPEIGKLEV